MICGSSDLFAMQLAPVPVMTSLNGGAQPHRNAVAEKGSKLAGLVLPDAARAWSYRGAAGRYAHAAVSPTCTSITLIILYQEQNQSLLSTVRAPHH